MSCPDWRRLERLGLPERLELPERLQLPEDTGRDALGTSAAAAAARWQEALRHLDGGCPRCWQEAVAVDPTLIFRRLPAAELGPAQEAEEVAAARLAVAAMRTASRSPARAMQQRARWAVAAGLTAMALVYGADHGWRSPMLPAAPASPASVSMPGSPRSLVPDLAGQGWAATPAALPAPAAAPAPAPAPATSRPSIEALGRPEARVYQIDSPHMSVVMIVDSKLDV